MAARSTRNKIRLQAKRAADNMDLVVEHLAKLDSMAAGRSPIINDKLPKLVVLLEEVKKLLYQFRDEL